MTCWRGVCCSKKTQKTLSTDKRAHRKPFPQTNDTLKTLSTELVVQMGHGQTMSSRNEVGTEEKREKKKEEAKR